MVTAKLIGCIIWALLVGASVTGMMCTNVVLNGRSPNPDFHSLYTAQIATLFGGVLLVPRCITAPAPCVRPGRWWSLIGGIFALPGFVCVPASKYVGVQVVLLTQLVAMLGTALLFDIRRGRVRLTDFKRLAGFGVVIAGVFVENLSVGSGSEGFSVEALLLLIGVFGSGVGYALQAKCNSRLARDVGSTARSTFISSMVCLVAGVPLDFVFGAGYRIGLVMHLHDWALWLYTGFQSAFYIASLSRLPGWMGYTTSYLVLLVGKLTSSSVVDAMGLSGKVVPFDYVRGLALTMVFVGTALFSTGGQRQQREEASFTISSLEPAFVDPANEDKTDPAGGAKLREGMTAAAATEASGVAGPSHA
uniref:EamA domain-containing protein n=1 Tax=Alexandrium monilatum TaxID=311494 RepID=A0A7S4QIL1_9DINO